MLTDDQKPDTVSVSVHGTLRVGAYSTQRVSESSFEISMDRGLEAAMVMVREALGRVMEQVRMERHHREVVKELEARANAVPVVPEIVVEPEDDEDDGEEHLREMEQAGAEAASGVAFGTTDGPERD